MLVKALRQTLLRTFSFSKMGLSHLAALPQDVIIEIATLLEDRVDILELALTCKSLHIKVLPILYRVVVLDGAAPSIRTLNMLSNHPEIGRHVRKLIIRLPDSGGINNQALEGYKVSAAVTGAARSLDALETFVWDCLESSPDDTMWFALRMACPMLKSISTVMGGWPLDSNSHLLDFKDLRCFSLTLHRSTSFAALNASWADDPSDSHGLWNMLIHKCPNLEELTVKGAYPSSIDAQMLTKGRWPRLRKLCVSNVEINWRFPPAEKLPFVEFLDAHPGVTSLEVCRHVLPASHMGDLSPDALANVRSFKGTFEQLQALPQLHPVVRKVSFVEPLLMREMTPLTIAGLLQRLACLSELGITLALHSVYDGGSLMRSLVASCPHLERLDLTCAQRPSFQLESISKTIRNLHKLHVLNLALVKCPGDERLAQGALRIARENPRLHRFTIAHMPSSLPVRLLFSAIPWKLTIPPLIEKGSYALRSDQHGLPALLSAQETQSSLWGLRQTAVSYRKDLRLGKRRTGGVWALLTEGSPAGEEMRMLMFAVHLMVLAMWGFMATYSSLGLSNIACIRL